MTSSSRVTRFIARVASGVYALFAMSSIGCVPQTESKAPLLPVAQFPDRARLDVLAAKPVAGPDAQPPVRVERWALEGTGSGDALAPLPPEQVPWHRALDEATAASDKVRTSRPLDCLAQEIGHFALARGGPPDDHLRRFMAARCGVHEPNARESMLISDVPENVTNAQLASEWGPKFDEELRRLVGKVPLGTRMGVWFGRRERRAGIFLTLARHEADLAPVSVSMGGLVQISGRLVGDRQSEMVFALANQGAQSVSKCGPDARLHPPDFAFLCSLAPGDSQAWIEVFTRHEDRFLGHSVARVLVQRTEGPLEYVAATSARVPVSSPEDFGKAALAELNRVRAQSKLTPLALAPKQSATNARLAAPLVDAEFHEDGKAADEIALGLMAGWDVDAVIRDGAILTGNLQASHDAALWVSECLESPAGRYVLLEPEAAQIAIGAAFDRPWPGIAVTATTYQLFGTDESTQGPRLLLDLIGRRRANVGKSAPVPMDNASLVAEAALVKDEHKHPEDAVHDAMAALSRENHLPMRGTFLMSNTLALSNLPAEIIDANTLTVAIAVTHIKVPRAAWGQYVILVVMADRGVSA
jgi:hypothetical protein